MSPELERLPDDLPRDRLFAEPLALAVTATEPETMDGHGFRVTFRVTIRDADGKRCPDLAVHAAIAGPERTASGLGHTDLMGAVKFRMTGPAGAYRFTVESVAGGALEVADQAAATAEIEVTGGASPQ